MSDKLPDLGSDGTKIKDHIEGMFGGVNPVIKSAGTVVGDMASLAADISKYSTKFLDLSAEEIKKISKQYLSSGIFEPKIKSKSDERRDEIAQRIFELNKDHYKFIKDSEKKKERLEKEKARSLKELGDGDSATRKLIEIQEKNPISRIFKTGMFDFRKGISDSIKSAPIFGEFDFVKDIANRINPEMESEKDIERLIEVGKEIESLETAIKKAGGEHTSAGAKLAEKLKEFKTEESEILGRTGDPLKESSELNQIEFDKLQAELATQNNILEEMLEALKTETDPALIKVLEDNRDSAERNAKELQEAIQENKDKQQSQTAEQEARIAAAKARAAGAPATSPIKAAKVSGGGTPAKSGSSFMFMSTGKGGLLNWAKSIGGYLLGSIFSILGMKSIWESILKKGFIPYIKQYLRVMLKKSLKKGILRSVVNIFKFIPRLAGFLVGGIIWAVTDAIEGMTEFGGLSGFLGGLLGGLDKGLMGALKGAGKWALIGAGIGSIVPIIGTAAGGIIGAIFGAIMGWIGGEKISKSLKSIGEWFSKKWDSLSKWWEGSDIKKTIDAGIKDLSEGVEFIAKKLGFGKEFKKLKKWFNEKLMTGKWFEDLKKDLGVVWGDIKIAFKKIWKNVSVWFGTKWETFKKDLDLVWGDIKKAFTGVFSAEGTIGKWWAELKTDLGVIWEDIKQNKLVKSITEFFGWFAELFSWENVKGMLKKMAKGAGVPDTFTNFVLSGLSRKAEPPKKVEPVKQFDSSDVGESRKQLDKHLNSDNLEYTTKDYLIEYIDGLDLDQSQKEMLRKEYLAKFTKLKFQENLQNPTSTPIRIGTTEQLASSEQTKKDIDNKMKLGQGKGDFQQSIVRTGDRMSITQNNKILQEQPLGRKPVAAN
jgi:hypothetical protein